MEVKNIIYYTRENDTSKTISLRELCLRDEFDLESIFVAAKDFVDEHDLLVRFRRMCWDEIDLDAVTQFYIRFRITTVDGKINFLKFTLRKDFSRE